MGFRVPIQPPEPWPRPGYGLSGDDLRPVPADLEAELEAIALGAPTPEEFVAWIVMTAGEGCTLWEFVIDKRRRPRRSFPADPGVILLR